MAGRETHVRTQPLLWKTSSAGAEVAIRHDQWKLHLGGRRSGGAQLYDVVADLRTDLGQPDLPFIACGIGEMGDPSKLADKAAMNRILLALPAKRPATACVDACELKANIGDSVHFAARMSELLTK